MWKTEQKLTKKSNREERSLVKEGRVFQAHLLEYLGLLSPNLKYLTERERKVITMRFLDLNTYKEVGEEINVTVSRARQIEAQAMERLRFCNQGKKIEQGRIK